MTPKHVAGILLGLWMVVGVARALLTWAAIVILALWMVVGVAVGLVWCGPAWVLSTLINWGLGKK